MFKKMKNRKGFTLIEMMVVIAIVAVLVAITVPTVAKAQTKAKASADAANLRSLSATIATRYVTTTDSDELIEGLEAPASKLRESPIIVVYVNNNEMQSYYADALVGSSANYRGITYNTTVSELGQTDGVAYDTPAGTLVCAFGGGEYAGMGLTDILYEDLKTSIEDAYENAKTEKEKEIYEQALADFENNIEETKKNKFIEAYANAYYNDRVANLKELEYEYTYTVNLPFVGEVTRTGTAKAYDINGDNVISDWEKAAVTESLASASLATYANTQANTAYNNGGLTTTNPDAATLAGQNAANAVDTSEEAAKNYAESQVNSVIGQAQAGLAGATAGAGAYESGMEDAADILGDTAEGQELQNRLEEILGSLGSGNSEG